MAAAVTTATGVDDVTPASPAPTAGCVAAFFFFLLFLDVAAPKAKGTVVVLCAMNCGGAAATIDWPAGGTAVAATAARPVPGPALRPNTREGAVDGGSTGAEEGAAGWACILPVPPDGRLPAIAADGEAVISA